MRWRAVLKDLKDDKGIICPQHSNESIVFLLSTCQKDVEWEMFSSLTFPLILSVL